MKSATKKPKTTAKPKRPGTKSNAKKGVARATPKKALTPADFTDRIPNGEGGFFEYSERERRFVYEYLNDPRHVAVGAARRAGYGGDNQTDGSLRVYASDLLKRPRIKAAINSAFESLAMPNFEIIYRLARLAAGSIGDVLNDDNELDLDLARESGSDYLIKSIKRKRNIIEIKSDGEGIEKIVVDETVEFTLNDRVKPLELLAKHGRLITDNVQHLNKNGDPSDPPAQVIFYLPDNGRDPKK